MTRPPLDDPRVRMALALAIDRETLVRDVLRLGQLPALHVVPPGMPGYEPPAERARLRPGARARAARGGRLPGRPRLPRARHPVQHARGPPQDRRAGGRPARARTSASASRAYNQEWQSYLATTQAGDYDLARAGWIGDYVDPNTFLDLWVTNGGNNQTGWGDPLYDRCIRAAADVEAFARAPELGGARPSPSGARALLASARRGARARRGSRPPPRLRLQLLREAEAILVQRAVPVIPLYFYVTSGLISPRVGGFHAGSSGRAAEPPGPAPAARRSPSRRREP